LRQPCGANRSRSKMLVARVKSWHRNVDDPEVANGPMPTARLNEYAGEWLEWHDIPVELHVSFALKDEVNLGKFFVVVRSTVGRNIDHVDGCHWVVIGHESPPGLAAGARHSWDFIKLGNAVAGRAGFAWRVHAVLA